MMAMAIRNMVTPSTKMSMGRLTMTMTMVMGTTTDPGTMARTATTISKKEDTTMLVSRTTTTTVTTTTTRAMASRATIIGEDVEVIQKKTRRHLVTLP